jgi:D-glycero-D-manno-heptose 1,7-bisphosphate phosphatase
MDADSTPMRAPAGTERTGTARAVFLDKDGTLVEDVPYNVDPARIRLTRGAAEGLRRLRDAGYRLVVVSNQSGVARGYFPEAALDRVWRRLTDLLAAGGVPVDGFYYCPHHPDGAVAEFTRVCDCRKPGTGLVLRAAQDLGLDLRRSWLVGDILDDIEAGHRAGCRTVLLVNGNETEWVLSPARQPQHTAADLNEAAGIILAADRIATPAGGQGGTR